MPIRPTRVCVDLSALASNASELKKQVGSAKIFAVVKADAYGHGAATVASRLADESAVHGFAVSLVEEGVALREAGIKKPILTMGPSLVGGADEVVARDLTAMVSTMEALGEVQRASARVGRIATIHVKVDTGMGRIGLGLAAYQNVVEAHHRGELKIAGVATHFACADTDLPGDAGSKTRSQLARFDEFLAITPAGALRHCANSSAILQFPASHWDAVRPGLALYGAGLAASQGVVEQVMSLHSELTQIRTLQIGDTASYGALWTAQRESRIGVIPVGYADGVPRSLTGRGRVLVRGQSVPLVGAISMDMALCDVTDVVGATVGDEAVLLGRQGDSLIRTRDFAEAAGITEYEVTCGVSKRVPREYP